MIEVIHTENAAQPLGHYSQAILHNGTIYVATQLGIVPGKPIEVGTITEQTTAILSNIEAILKAADSDLSNVLRVTIYISNIQYWDEVNAVYSKFFKEHKPARGVIPAGPFHKGFQVAMDVIAAQQCKKSPPIQ